MLVPSLIKMLQSQGYEPIDCEILFYLINDLDVYPLEIRHNLSNKEFIEDILDTVREHPEYNKLRMKRIARGGKKQYPHYYHS